MKVKILGPRKYFKANISGVSKTLFVLNKYIIINNICAEDVNDCDF